MSRPMLKNLYNRPEVPGDFMRTVTSEPTEEEIRAAEQYVGYPLPNGAYSIVGTSHEENVALQCLAHPDVFRRLAALDGE